MDEKDEQIEIKLLRKKYHKLKAFGRKRVWFFSKKTWDDLISPKDVDMHDLNIKLMGKTPAELKKEIETYRKRFILVRFFLRLKAKRKEKLLLFYQKRRDIQVILRALPPSTQTSIQSSDDQPMLDPRIMQYFIKSSKSQKIQKTDCTFVYNKIDDIHAAYQAKLKEIYEDNVLTQKEKDERAGAIIQRTKQQVQATINFWANQYKNERQREELRIECDAHSQTKRWEGYAGNLSIASSFRSLERCCENLKEEYREGNRKFLLLKPGEKLAWVEQHGKDSIIRCDSLITEGVTLIGKLFPVEQNLLETAAPYVQKLKELFNGLYKQISFLFHPDKTDHYDKELKEKALEISERFQKYKEEKDKFLEKQKLNPGGVIKIPGYDILCEQHNFYKKADEKMEEEIEEERRRTKEAEARRKEAEARRKEAEARTKEAEARIKEEEARIKEYQRQIDEIKNPAAVTIQSWWRGHQVRKQLKEKNKPQQVSTDNEIVALQPAAESMEKTILVPKT